MEERIDFVLEPGVIIFAILFLVVINVLLGLVLYPYFRSESGTEATEGGDLAPEPEEGVEPMSATDDEEAFNQRVDEFLEEVRSEKVE